MSQDLNQMTNAELKRYISKHRNNEDAFHAALEVLMSRRDPHAPWYPHPHKMADPEREMEAIFREKIRQLEMDKSADL
jgi:hypothetical protein